VAEHSYRTYPGLSDGMLSKVRASVVNAHVLAEVATDLGIPAHLRLGKGEDTSGGRAKVSILADTMEAVIGAVYLDAGLEAARNLVLPSSRTGSTPPWGSRASPTTRAASRRRPCAWVAGSRTTTWRVSAPITPGGTWPRLYVAGRCLGTGRALQEGRRAGRRPGGLRNAGSRESGEMPELPEVETIRRDLQGEVVGRKIKAVDVRNGRTVSRHPSAKQFRAQLEGRTITAINRAGTYVLLVLDDGATLVVQLGSGGSLHRVKSVKEAKAPTPMR